MATENDPSIKINLNGTSFEMTRGNSTLFRFLGHAAIYDHIFSRRDDLEQPEADNQVLGTYMFRSLLGDPTVFDRITELMEAQQFPMILNMADASECDKEAYMSIAIKDIEDTVPEGWL